MDKFKRLSKIHLFLVGKTDIFWYFCHPKLNFWELVNHSFLVSESLSCLECRLFGWWLDFVSQFGVFCTLIFRLVRPFDFTILPVSEAQKKDDWQSADLT